MSAFDAARRAKARKAGPESNLVKALNVLMTLPEPEPRRPAPVDRETEDALIETIRAELKRQMDANLGLYIETESYVEAKDAHELDDEVGIDGGIDLRALARVILTPVSKKEDE